MMRSKFDEQLSLLNRELISMGALCESAISLASQAVLEGDTDLAKQVIPQDNEIDQKERSIEALCLKLLLQQQPVARDLRQVSAALKMITDMERIGDQAADIAEIIPYLNRPKGNSAVSIRQMAKATSKMVTESVEAFVRQDLELAHRVILSDDEVDGLFDSVKKELIHWISQEPESGEFALDMLMIAKYFERIGDHAVNIAEWVVFSMTGMHNGEREL